MDVTACDKGSGFESTHKFMKGKFKCKVKK